MTSRHRHFTALEYKALLKLSVICILSKNPGAIARNSPRQSIPVRMINETDQRT
jgi:hypothetical protein